MSLAALHHTERPASAVFFLCGWFRDGSASRVRQQKLTAGKLPFKTMLLGLTFHFRRCHGDGPRDPADIGLRGRRKID